jgi:hypothetical protein
MLLIAYAQQCTLGGQALLTDSRWAMPCVCCAVQFDESLITSLANEDLVDSLLQELQEDFPQLLKPLLHDRWARLWRLNCVGLCFASLPRTHIALAWWMLFVVSCCRQRMALSCSCVGRGPCYSSNVNHLAETSDAHCW